MHSWIGVAVYELRWLPRRLGSWRGIALYAGFLIVLGYLFPMAMGMDFLNPHLLLAYACSSPFFVSSVAVESFADTRDEASPKSTLAGKLVAASGFGWASSVLALGLGLASVNLRSNYGSTILPAPEFLAGILSLGLSLSVFTVVAAALLCLHMPPPEAKAILRRAFFLALLAVILLARFGEVEWKDSFTALLLPETVLRVAIVSMLVFLFLSGAGLLVVLRHPRYSGAVPQP